MFCSKCGEENLDNAGFCKKCGAPLKPTSKLIEEGSATGLEPNIAGLLCYVLGWITGLVFYFIEKEDRFVRFHAVQSIIVFGGITVVQIGLWILALIPYIGILFWIMGILLSLGSLVLWILLMIKAFQGEKYMLPKVGEIAEKYI
ncbi:MAG: DUF4870 domain-containing protein [Chloroflexi bacterium]|nr:DUF4870 domain-containing protein [Chloroflexota bacterium]